MIVLKIIGWVLLGILALILLALCVKVRFDLEYSSENTSVVLRWLFVRFKLYPAKKKEKQKTEEGPEPPPEEPAEEKPEEEEQKPKQKSNLLKTIYDSQGIDGLISVLQQVMTYTKTFFGNLLHGFVIDELYLDVCCTRSDAAATAIYYGEVCSVLFPLLGALAAKCRMKKYDVNVYPDFIARFSNVSFITSFHFTPIYLIGITVAYGMKMLFGVLLGIIIKISGAKKEKDGSRNKNTKSKRKSEEK